MTSARRSSAVHVVLAVALSTLPFAVAVAHAQSSPCDGNFQSIYEFRHGSLKDIDFSAPGDGWAVGRDTDSSEVIRFYDEGFERSVVSAPNGKLRLKGVVAFAPDDVFAVGHTASNGFASTAAMHWDGAGWTAMEVPSPGVDSFLEAVGGVASNDVWAVGRWDRHKTYESETLVLHYDGTSWTRVASPSPGFGYADLTAISAVTASSAWAAGQSGVTGAIVLHWNGTEWKREGLALGLKKNEFVWGLTADDEHAAWFVGFSERRHERRPGILVRWANGDVDRPSFPTGRGILRLKDVVVSGDRAWTGGYRYTDEIHPVVAEWGNGWREISFEGIGPGEIESLAIEDSGSTWALGQVATSELQYTDLIEKRCDA